jgi:hypothetical protein
VLQLRLSEVRDVFDLRASDNLVAPLASILFTLFHENEMKKRSVLQPRLSVARVVLDLRTSANLITSSLPIAFPVLSEK